MCGSDLRILIVTEWSLPEAHKKFPTPILKPHGVIAAAALPGRPRSSWLAPSVKAASRTTLEQYVGLDVSLKEISVCVVDADGAVVQRSNVSTDPDAIAQHFAEMALRQDRIVHESSQLWIWLRRQLERLSLPIICADARVAHNALSAKLRLPPLDFVLRHQKSESWPLVLLDPEKAGKGSGGVPEGSCSPIGRLLSKTVLRSAHGCRALPQTSETTHGQVKAQV